MARPKKPEGTHSPVVAPTGVRLPPELRAELAREAAIHQRTLSAEIVVRLQRSMRAAPYAGHTSHVADQPRLDYAAQPAMGGAERMLLSRFAQLLPEEQLALLTLLGIKR
jgi:hypothetical protein